MRIFMANTPLSPDAMILEKTTQETKVEPPKLYKVILHNDHYTTMEFVVEVLITIFNKTAKEAHVLMLAVHQKGYGVCGVYTLDMAKTKVAQVYGMAKKKDFPLKCSFEEA